MNVTRWEPLREMDEMFRQFAPLLGRTLPVAGGSQEMQQWRPRADISETDQEYLVKLELPDVPKEDVKITVEDGVITVRGERKQRKEVKDEKEVRVETFYGAFARSFALPDNVDAEHIRAEAKDGVLRVHIPKVEQKQPKQLSVEVH